MGNFAITLTGERELRRRINNYKPAVARMLVRKTLKRAWNPVLQDARNNVPTDSGKLKRSMKMRLIKSQENYFGVYIRTGIWQELDISPEATDYYPASLEFGTAKIPPHPYFRPAVSKKKAFALFLIARDLKNELEKNPISRFQTS